MTMDNRSMAAFIETNKTRMKQNKLLTRTIETNGKHMALSVHVTCQKPGRGVNIITFDTWSKPGPLWWWNKTLVIERRHKNSIRKDIFCLLCFQGYQNRKSTTSVSCHQFGIIAYNSPLYQFYQTWATTNLSPSILKGLLLSVAFYYFALFKPKSSIK